VPPERHTLTSPLCAAAASAQLQALSEKERQLGAARQRASALEAEVADLERECALRQAQEAALKEAVRDLERELQRQRLPGKQGAAGGGYAYGDCWR
jgi:predicted  nucleic acid-binding Zn-ribbon protein